MELHTASEKCSRVWQVKLTICCLSKLRKCPASSTGSFKMELQTASENAASPPTVPGESSRSSRPPMRSHLSVRVTPGRAALSHIRRPSRRLMSALLPTLGKPTTTTRTARGLRPRRARASLMRAVSRSAALVTCAAPLTPDP